MALLDRSLCCPGQALGSRRPGSLSWLPEVVAAKAGGGRLGRFTGAVAAAQRLPCGARSCGPVAKLAARPAAASLKQSRRVRCGCALRARPQALCSSAPQRRAPAGPHPPLQQRWGRSEHHRWWLSGCAAGGGGAGSLWGGEERRVEVGARSALRNLTCRICLNAATAGREVSYAARPRPEHRSEVAAKLRPPQREPAPPPPAATRSGSMSPFLQPQPDQAARPTAPSCDEFRQRGPRPATQDP